MESDNKFKIEEQEYSKISPFELKNQLIEKARESIRKQTIVLLNAGRGNPNWIATEAREAFFTLGKFGIEECKRVMDVEGGIAGIPLKDGITARFETFIRENQYAPGIKLLKDFYTYMLLEHSANPDELIHEWAESVIGDQYPVPDRILKFAEIIIRDYLNEEMCDGNPPEGIMDLFATEGSTAGMCYAFDSLEENFLLHKGDKVALLVPAFTPYIEIPELERYSYKVLNIKADKVDSNGMHTWQYNPEDIYKLKDNDYKAVFIINPSNPPSYQMDAECLNAFKDVIANYNPNLMIITDDVYGTYVPNFRSLIADIPFNTMCLYSYSKYFGATGWRIAVIAIYQHNIFDKLISELSDEDKQLLSRRYGSLTMDVANLKFIDRMVADSRQVALNHTAGLSLPQQMQMALFSASSILDKKKRYKEAMLRIIKDRLTTLWDNAEFTLVPDPLRAGYYSEIDMLIWAKKYYGDKFVKYLQETYNPLDIVFRLADKTGIVVLNGGGFDGPTWSIRVSLANLNDDDYITIGKQIRNILSEYATIWKNKVDNKIEE